MKIAMVSSECEPYAKTGGLADVVDALARALGELGHDVDVYLPRYRGLEPPGPAQQMELAVRQPGSGGPSGAAPVRGDIGPASAASRGLPGPIDDTASPRPASPGLAQPPRDARVPGRTAVRLLTARADGYRLRLVDHPASFDRAAYYGEGGSDYPDNGARFALLGRAALEAIRSEGGGVAVLHGHDWQAGPAVLLRDFEYGSDPAFGGMATMVTCHNLAYHGWVPRERSEPLGLPPDVGKSDGVDLLREEVARADIVNTVSPTYAEESRTPEFGAGLDDVLRGRGDTYLGILNGIDLRLWDPETDGTLVERFSASDIDGKRACKRDLGARLGIDLWGPGSDTTAGDAWGDRGAPLFGLVGRLDPQKGFDLLAGAARAMLEDGARMVILGTGDERLVQGLRAIAGEWPGRLAILERFDRDEARRIYAGSDLLLMPSRFEPCGQSQMIAMRYGTIPLVRSTGGLADTVTDADDHPDDGDGFVFAAAEPAALAAAGRRAIDAYRDERRWAGLTRVAMGRDFSWTASAPRYLEAYARALAIRARGDRTGRA